MNAALLKEVVVQMEKDLAMSAVPYQFVATEAEGLLTELAKWLVEVDKGTGLAQLMYRVDLPESQQQVGSYQQLSEHIWNRVTSKVWLRKKWSSLHGPSNDSLA